MRPVLVFDGDCGFCPTTAHWIEARLPDDVDVEPWQFLDLEVLRLTQDDVTKSAWWIDAWGHRHGGHKAIGRALIAAGRWWRIPGWLCLVPPFSWVASVGYKLIARYRYKMPGGTPACRVPPRPA